MKIFHIMWKWRLGGTEMMVAGLMNGQVAAGHDVTLIIVSRDGHQGMLNSLDPRIKVKFIPRNDNLRIRQNIQALATLNAWLMLQKPDILHMHDMSMPRAVKVLRRNQKLLTLHIEYDDIEPLDSIDSIVAVSNRIRDYVSEKCHRPSAVIHNGIPLDGLTQRNESRWRDIFRIVQVGRLDTKFKGQDLMLRALQQLKESGHRDIHVEFIGEGKDEQLLKSMAHELGIEDIVTWCGAMERGRIMNRLPEYDLMVQPSRSEAFGLTVAEAMAVGLPVLVTDIPGPSEIIDNGRYGKLFQSDNSEDLAAKILDIMDNYHEAIEKAKHGRRFVGENFSIERCVGRYLDLYDSMKNRK